MVFFCQTGCGKTTSLEAFVSQLVNQNKTVIVFRTQADEVGFMQSATSLDPYFGLPPEGVTGKFLQATIEAHIGKSAARHHGDLVDLTYPNRPASLKDVLLEVRNRRTLAETGTTAKARAGLVKWKVFEEYLVDIVGQLGNIKPYFPAPLISHLPGIYLCDLAKFGKAVQ